MGHGTQRATSTHSMRDNISQREGNRSRMTKIDAPNTYNIYLSGIKVNNPEMQKTVQQMMKNPAMRRVMNQLPQY
jgi:polygalacturonase